MHVRSTFHVWLQLKTTKKSQNNKNNKNKPTFKQKLKFKTMQIRKQQKQKKQKKKQKKQDSWQKSLAKKIIYFLQLLTDIAFNPRPGSCCNAQRYGNDESG